MPFGLPVNPWLLANKSWQLVAIWSAFVAIIVYLVYTTWTRRKRNPKAVETNINIVVALYMMAGSAGSGLVHAKPGSSLNWFSLGLGTLLLLIYAFILRDKIKKVIVRHKVNINSASWFLLAAYALALVPQELAYGFANSATDLAILNPAFNVSLYVAEVVLVTFIAYVTWAAFKRKNRRSKLKVIHDDEQAN